MDAPELLALSLGLSIAAAALGLLGGGLIERASADPRLRDRIWSAALILPALPPLTVGLMLLAPAPVREISVAAASLPTGMAAPAETVLAASPVGPVFDAGAAAWTVLGLAALLTGARLAALILRAGRLARVIRRAEEPRPEVTAMVEAAARDLSVRAPRVGISAAASEPLLTGLVRARLILPAGLTATDAAAAVISHELAHLKRGDHRALWLEEGLLALLAANPLMPVLRARRAAAREEACDALALGGATPEARRAYARSLIDALRSRAGPQALPALTFTGAGRRAAMHRLKAVMIPAAPAGWRTRLLAAGAAVALAASAGAGSLAVAGEREAVVRVLPPATATAPAGEARSARPQAQSVQPGRDPDTAAQAARQAMEDSLSRLTPEQQTRFRDPTAADYQAICLSGDPADGGFCAGVMFSFLHGAPANGVCAPEAVLNGGGDRATLRAYVEGGKAQIAQLTPRRGVRAAAFAGRALQAAYPCDAAAFRAEAARMKRDYVPLTVSLDIEGRPLSVEADETLRVILTDENGVVMNTHGALNNSGQASGPLGPLGMALHVDDFPKPGDRARTYTLTGEIRGPGRALRYVAEPVTLRLAPGAGRTDLRPTMSFRPAA